MTLDEAIRLALQTLKQVMEEKLSSSNVEFATVTAAAGFRILPKEDIEAVLQTLNA